MPVFHYALDFSGLSPRVRGSRCARATEGNTRRFRVYPRVCGAACTGQHAGELRARARSIPACAGQPPRVGACKDVGRVYPRVCGAAYRPFGQRELRAGLSPRVRGSLLRQYRHRLLVWSIPACAGQPSPPSSRPCPQRVYPRVCGAAFKDPQLAASAKGLSPRVRGSPGSGIPYRQCLRSIPACAGQPARRKSLSRSPRVYPRVCGAAGGAWQQTPWTWGLSPRVRGSRRRLAADAMDMGSIPACAGQPNHPIHSTRLGTVYPRVCGAAHTSITHTGATGGLSPRVRGSLDKLI